MSLPQTPEIFDGLRRRFCSFIIFMETMEKLFRKRLQQTTFPQLPTPPMILASSLTPTCRISIRTLNSFASSLTSSLKSTLSSEKK